MLVRSFELPANMEESLPIKTEYSTSFNIHSRSRLIFGSYRAHTKMYLLVQFKLNKNDPVLVSEPMRINRPVSRYLLLINVLLHANTPIILNVSLHTQDLMQINDPLISVYDTSS